MSTMTKSLDFYKIQREHNGKKLKHQRKSEETVEAATYTGSAAPMAFQKMA